MFLCQAWLIEAALRQSRQKEQVDQRTIGRKGKNNLCYGLPMKAELMGKSEKNKG